MTAAQLHSYRLLYEQDETAWLELMAELIRLNRLDEVDYANLAEYLADMARRDRREVESRLVILLFHALKWVHQPSHRSRSWRATIIEQRQELASWSAGECSATMPKLFSRRPTLKRSNAAAETGLEPSAFPHGCPFTLEQLSATDFLADEAAE